MTDVNPEVGTSRIENEVARAPETETNVADVDENKYNLNFKLKQILCCVVCKEVRRSFIFQVINFYT